MPELPEVHTIVTRLASLLGGARIARVFLDRGDVVREGRAVLAKAVIGRRIESIARHGKRMSLVLSPGGIITIHLGMSGRLTVESCDSPLLKHTHLRFRFAGRTDELRFRDPRRFGGVWFYEGVDAIDRREDTSGYPSGLARLGPDALAIRAPQLREMLRKKRQIKAILLDQRIISGLGNIYCDEALFRAGIHPLANASALSTDQVRRLAGTIRTTLTSAIRFGGSTFREYRNADGDEGRFQKLHRVYGRSGEPCLKCGAIIVRTIVAGRSTHTCPACQKTPVAR